MSTLVISDLHLGSRRHRDVLALAGTRAPLLHLASEMQRVVLLGDVLELLDIGTGEAVEVARPLLEGLGAALGPAGRIVLTGGNHDLALFAGPIAGAVDDGSLALDARIDPSADRWLSAFAELLAPAQLEIRYPGVWLRDDLYATHGHYLDRHIAFSPTLEDGLPPAARGALGALRAALGAPPGDVATPAEYERALAPLYGAFIAARNLSASTWLPGPASARSSALADLAIPLAGRLGLGDALAPLGAGALGLQLRRTGLRAMAEVVDRLAIDAAHVIFGHIHLAGPLPGDRLERWVTPGGTALHNSGSWVYEPALLAGSGAESPYWPGCALVVDAEGPPRPERLLGGFTGAELRR